MKNSFLSIVLVSLVPGILGADDRPDQPGDRSQLLAGHEGSQNLDRHEHYQFTDPTPNRPIQHTPTMRNNQLLSQANLALNTQGQHSSGSNRAGSRHSPSGSGSPHSGGQLGSDDIRWSQPKADSSGGQQSDAPDVQHYLELHRIGEGPSNAGGGTSNAGGTQNEGGATVLNLRPNLRTGSHSGHPHTPPRTTPRGNSQTPIFRTTTHISIPETFPMFREWDQWFAKKKSAGTVLPAEHFRHRRPKAYDKRLDHYMLIHHNSHASDFHRENRNRYHEVRSGSFGTSWNNVWSGSPQLQSAV